MYRGACRKDSVMAGIEELLAHACEGSSYLVARIGHHTIVSKLREISNSGSAPVTLTTCCKA